MQEKYSIRDLITKPIVMKINEEQQALRMEIMDYIIDKQQPYPIALSNQKEAIYKLEKLNILRIEDEQVVCIYPISSIPTNKKVYFADGRSAYAMCAIDAIGLHYTYQEKIRIESQCQYCKEKIIFEVNEGKIYPLQGADDIFILHTDLENMTNWSCCCCNIMHFFDCKDSLHKWKEEHAINATTFAVNLETANKIAWLLFSR